MENQNEPQKKSAWKSIRLGLIVFVVLMLYAYGVEITNIDLAELRSEQRQQSLTRVMRALFQPDIIAYEQEELIINVPVYVPCPADGLPAEAGQATSGDAFVTVSPACGAPSDTVLVEGHGFYPHSGGPVRFVPGPDPANTVTLGREVMETDGDGYFQIELELPNRESDDVQYIRATARQSIGSPYFTQNAEDTWEKIIETIFMAFLATTVGTILAFPLSFLAARNLMRPVRSPLASVTLNFLGWPVGLYVGYQLATRIVETSDPLLANTLVALVAILLIPVLSSFLFRWAMPEDEVDAPNPVLRIGGLIVLGILVTLAFLALAALVVALGSWLSSSLGFLSFFGTFLFQVGDFLRTLAPTVFALVAGGILGGIGARVGEQLTEKMPEATVKTINIVLTAIAGAVLMALLGAAADWLYQIGRQDLTLWWPATIGAILGAILAFRKPAKETLGIGMVIYYVVRTVLNTVRSIEPLVMAIVFVIAVGIGPFAGVIALGLHTIVSLAKLYSEQVESIATGPIEAIQATGANRLQTIVYAVIPQIIPPYISYTMYRWDINVRMSTIIGFVGGGGIGFLLAQNANLLNYRAASTQMLAIAVVVASLDYISSVVRERYT